MQKYCARDRAPAERVCTKFDSLLERKAAERAVALLNELGENATTEQIMAIISMASDNEMPLHEIGQVDVEELSEWATLRYLIIQQTLNTAFH